jgi:predicted amidohydrolase
MACCILPCHTNGAAGTCAAVPNARLAYHFRNLPVAAAVAGPDLGSVCASSLRHAVSGFSMIISPWSQTHGVLKRQEPQQTQEGPRHASIYPRTAERSD